MTINKIRNLIQKNNCEFVHLKKVKSTMDSIKEIIKKKNKNVILIADEQTEGRGRRGNKWISPKGNIYCSIALKNKIPLKNYFTFSILTIISIKKSLKEFGIKNIYFKWPNDIFFENKKFAGIILENFKINNKNDYVIIGIGLNYMNSPQLLNYNSTFLKNFANINDKIDFLNNFFFQFFYYWQNYQSKKNYLYSQFKKSLMFLNKSIKINIINDKNYIYGKFKGINRDGSLILDQGNKIINIYSGSIIL